LRSLSLVGSDMSQHKHAPGPYELDTTGWPLLINSLAVDMVILAEIPLPGGSNGADRWGRTAVATGRLFTAAPDLLAACEALQDALSNILESAGSPYRDGKRPPASDGDYLISRYDRAESLRAIRKSFKALAKAKGGK
jgi:hypothetical protein